MSEFFNVGQIVNTHGIKGEVKVFSLTDNPENFKRYKSVFVEDKWMNILGVKFQKDRVILKLEGIEDMTQAETYKQKYISIERDKEPELEEDTFYVADLIGCIVYDTEEVNLGPVSEVLQTKNNDVYWIKEPKELLIPVLREIVLEVVPKEKRILIKPVREWQDED